MKKVTHAAKRCGLFVMADGTGNNFRYEFWDTITGKKVLTYYHSSKRWLSGDGQREGIAEDYRAALDTVSDKHRQDSRTDKNKPAHLRSKPV